MKASTFQFLKLKLGEAIKSTPCKLAPSVPASTSSKHLCCAVEVLITHVEKKAHWLMGNRIPAKLSLARKKKKSYNKKEKCLSFKTKKKQLAPVVEMFYKATARGKKNSKSTVPECGKRAKNINIQEHSKPSASCKKCLRFPWIINKYGSLSSPSALPANCLFESYAVKPVFQIKENKSKGPWLSCFKYHSEEV